MLVNDNDIAQSAIDTDRYWSIDIKCPYCSVYYSLVYTVCETVCRVDTVYRELCRICEHKAQVDDIAHV